MRRPIAPTTMTSENLRKTQSEMDAQPGILSASHNVYGRIIKVNPDKALIKAVDIYDGSPISGGRWIGLAHSVREVAERWGTIKKGWLVHIHYRGPDASDAMGTIIKESGESIMGTGLEENKMEQGLFKIFAPGIGIG